MANPRVGVQAEVCIVPFWAPSGITPFLKAIETRARAGCFAGRGLKRGGVIL